MQSELVAAFPLVTHRLLALWLEVSRYDSLSLDTSLVPLRRSLSPLPDWSLFTLTYCVTMSHVPLQPPIQKPNHPHVGHSCSQRVRYGERSLQPMLPQRLPSRRLQRTTPPSLPHYSKRLALPSAADNALVSLGFAVLGFGPLGCPNTSSPLQGPS